MITLDTAVVMVSSAVLAHVTWVATPADQRRAAYAQMTHHARICHHCVRRVIVWVFRRLRHVVLWLCWEITTRLPRR